MSEARFVLCDICQKHGRIVLADGFKGGEFCHQQEGFIVVRNGINHERFSADEAEKISAAIQASPLPKKWHDVKINYQWAIEMFNQLRSAGYLYHEITAHIYLEVDDFTGMPADFPQFLEQHYRDTDN